jgi:hypothetical protein
LKTERERERERKNKNFKIMSVHVVNFFNRFKPENNKENPITTEKNLGLHANNCSIKMGESLHQ